MSLITISDLYVKKLSFYSQFCIVVVPTPQHGMVVRLRNMAWWSRLRNMAWWSRLRNMAWWSRLRSTTTVHPNLKIKPGGRANPGGRAESRPSGNTEVETIREFRRAAQKKDQINAI